MKRVHEREIEYREDEYGDAVPFLDGVPFTGVIWSELRGHLYETQYEEGELHGTSRGFYPDGSRMYVARSHEGRSIGTYRRWHPGGKLAEEHVHDEQGRLVSRLQWSETGVLLREQRSEGDVWRDYYATGPLLRERGEEGWIYYAPDGEWAFREGRDAYSVVWNASAIIRAYPAMLDERECETFLLRWVREMLDEDRSLGVEVLGGLIERGGFRIATRAMRIAVDEGVEEAVGSIETRKDSTLETDDHPHLDHPLGHHARRALVDLSAADPVGRERAREALQRAARERMEARREAADSSAPWDRTRLDQGRIVPGRLVEALVGRMEVTTGDRIYREEPDVREVEHLAVFEYQARPGWTSRVVRTTTYDPGLAEGATQAVLFDRERPEHAVLLSAYADRFFVRGEVWEEGVRRPVSLEEWLARVEADPELRRETDEGVAEWTAEPRAWFAWADGCVFTRNPTAAGLAKLDALAAALGARVHLNDKGKPAREGSAAT